MIRNCRNFANVHHKQLVQNSSEKWAFDRFEMKDKNLLGGRFVRSELLCRAKVVDVQVYSLIKYQLKRLLNKH